MATVRQDMSTRYAGTRSRLGRRPRPRRRPEPRRQPANSLVDAPLVDAPAVPAARRPGSRVAAPVATPVHAAARRPGLRVEASRVEASRVEASRVEAPRVEAPRVEAPRRAGSRRAGAYLRDFALGIGVLALFVLGAGAYYTERFEIRSGSMAPTLAIDETVWAVRVMGPPERGDIVAFPNPLDPTGQQVLIKRVIALPGEIVDATGGSLHVNLGRLDESVWIDQPEPTADFGPIEVPDGHLFVMGDNRDESTDSRVFGAIPVESVTYVIIGRD